MSVHIAEATVDPLGRVVLDKLPFQPGERVEVIVRTHEASSREAVDLRGSVLTYEDPFEPVGFGNGFFSAKTIDQLLPSKVSDLSQISASLRE